MPRYNTKSCNFSISSLVISDCRILNFIYDHLQFCISYRRPTIILLTNVAVTIVPERTRTKDVVNRIVLSVNSMNPIKTLRINIDFRSATSSNALADLTTSWNGFSHAYILITCKNRSSLCQSQFWKLKLALQINNVLNKFLRRHT